MSTPNTNSPKIVSNKSIDSVSRVTAQPRQGWRVGALITILALGGLGGSYAVSERFTGPLILTELFNVTALFKANPAADQLAEEIRQHDEDVFRLMTELRDLRLTLQVLRHDVDRSADELSGQQHHALAQIDRTDRLSQDNSITLARIAAQLDRVEYRGAANSPSTKPAAVALEGPATTGSIRSPKPRKEQRVDGWVLREVHDNDLAIIENGTVGLLGLRVGQSVPGVGPIEKIERRGQNWVVVTGKGVIDATR